MERRTQGQREITPAGVGSHRSGMSQDGSDQESSSWAQKSQGDLSQGSRVLTGTYSQDKKEAEWRQPVRGDDRTPVDARRAGYQRGHCMMK